MHFVSILIVLLILKYRRRTLHAVQNDRWFYALAGESAGTSSGLAVFMGGIVLPCLVLSVLLLLLHNVFWGLPDLLLSVLVLMYSLGRGRYISLYDAYRAAWQQQDAEKIGQVLQQLQAGYQPAADVTSLHMDARYLFIYNAFTRLFVVLFWFALTGPVTALLYRLSRLLLQRVENPYALLLVNTMEWPVARLFALSAALLGNFSAAFARCKRGTFTMQQPNAAMIHEISLAALGQDMQWQCSRFVVENSEDDIAEKAIAEISAVQQLIHRCMIIAVVLIAVFHIVL